MFMKFVYLPHTADLKFRAFGKSLNEVYENSAYALFNSISDLKVKSNKIKKFSVKGKDLEGLMLRFLEELLFLYETKGFMLSKIKVKIDKDCKKLEAELFGEERKEKTARHYIKAVTYNDMFVKKIGRKFVSQVVLDV